MTNPQDYRNVTNYPFKYRGNIVWPILFLIVFPPLGLALLLLNLTIKKDGVFYGLKYHGSECWLIFWSIILFPVAVLLGFFNGFDVIAIDN